MQLDPNIADNIHKANFMMLSKLLMEKVLIDTAQTCIYTTALCPKMSVLHAPKDGASI